LNSENPAGGPGGGINAVRDFRAPNRVKATTHNTLANATIGGSTSPFTANPGLTSSWSDQAERQGSSVTAAGVRLPRHGTYSSAGIQAFTQPVRSPPRSALSPTTQHGVRAVTAHATRGLVRDHTSTSRCRMRYRGQWSPRAANSPGAWSAPVGGRHVRGRTEGGASSWHLSVEHRPEF
jgi:hypothetical protein